MCVCVSISVANIYIYIYILYKYTLSLSISIYLSIYLSTLKLLLNVPPLINVLGKANVQVWLTAQTVDFNSSPAKHKHFLEQPEQIEAKNGQRQIVPVWLGMFSLFLACLSYQHDSPCHPPSLPTWTALRPPPPPLQSCPCETTPSPSPTYQYL